jgi:hypothetical protein
MAPAVRIEYGGVFYHVMARGNRRERIFRDEADRLLFYQTLGEACVLPLILCCYFRLLTIVDRKIWALLRA